MLRLEERESLNFINKALYKYKYILIYFLYHYGWHVYLSWRNWMTLWQCLIRYFFITPRLLFPIDVTYCDNDPENRIRVFDPLQIYGLYYGSSSTQSGRVITLVAGVAKIRGLTIICHTIWQKNVYTHTHTHNIFLIFHILYMTISKNFSHININVEQTRNFSKRIFV